MATDIEDMFGEEEKPLLSAKEIEEAKAKAAAKVNEAMKKAALDKIVEEETQRLQRLAGKKTGIADMDELVDVMIDLPEFCPDIRINGTIYNHGHEYSLPRHMANSLREIMQRTRRHQDVLDGKSMEETYRASKPVTLSAHEVQ